MLSQLSYSLRGTRINAFCSRPIPVESDIQAAVHEHLEIEVNWRAPRGDGFDQARRTKANLVSRVT